MREELELVARLRPVTMLAQAAAEMPVDRTAPSRQVQASGDTQGTVPVLALLSKESLVGDVRPALAVLFGAVGLVLFIASANAASLMLAARRVAAGRSSPCARRSAAVAPGWCVRC